MSAGAGEPTTHVGTFVVAGAVLAYTLSLRRFGLDLVDEGTLLAQFGDVARGAIPYRDFETGYGPLGFYWNAAALRLLGGDLVDVRTVLAVVHAASAGLLYAIARRAGGPGIAAAVIALVWGMLRPVAPGAFATFNVPYPSWLAETFGYAAVLVLLGGAHGPARVATVGALWGLAFLAKQNAGALGLAGTVIHLALTDPRQGGDTPRWIGAFVATIITLAFAAVALTGGMSVWEGIVLGTPVLALALAVVRARPTARSLGAGAVLGAGFLGIVVPALVAVGLHVGADVVLHEVLHLGSSAAVRFRLPYPTPLGIVDTALREAPSSLVAGRRLVDGLWMLALPAAGIVGATRLATSASARAAHERVALVAVGTLLYLQLYPRADMWHVLPAAGLLVTLGLSMLGDVLRGAGAVIVMSLALAALRSVPTVPVVTAVLTPPTASVPAVPHATIRWDLLEGAPLTRIPPVAAALAGVHSLFGFPALGFFNFVTDAPSPVRDDYLFPGYSDPEEIAAMLAQLEAAPPEAVVFLDAPVAFFRESFAAHPDVVAWLRSPRFVQTSVPPYTIGRRVGP